MSHCLIDNAELLPGLDLRCVGAEVVAIGDPAAQGPSATFDGETGDAGGIDTRADADDRSGPIADDCQVSGPRSYDRDILRDADRATTEHDRRTCRGEREVDGVTRGMGSKRGA